jgi:hypothetical protein
MSGSFHVDLDFFDSLVVDKHTLICVKLVVKILVQRERRGGGHKRVNHFFMFCIGFFLKV